MKEIKIERLRFKDDNGNNFPEWKMKKLGDIFTFRTTNSFSRENLNYESGSIKNIHYGDIHTKFKTHFDITKEIVPYINNEISLNRLSDDSFCKEGDLIIADASEDYADIGKSIEIVNINNEKAVAGLHTLHARPNLEEVAIGFCGHLMKSENIRLQIKTIAQGTKVLSVTSSRLSSISINLPSLEEQTKIANFLSAIDEKIENLEKELDELKAYKKGVMQAIFNEGEEMLMRGGVIPD
jgi:type I restriction enzyme, S subunit